MEAKEYYEKGRYKKKISHKQEKHLKYLLLLMDDQLGRLRPRKILDVGCGDGLLAKMLKDKTGAETHGIDISKKGLRLAKEKGILVKRCDLDKKFPFRNEHLDLIVSKQVIEHVLNPDHFLNECNRILRRGGLLILTTPNLAAWYNRVLLLFGVYPIFLEASMRDKLAGTRFIRKFAEAEQGVGHIRVLTLHALLDLLELNNFSVEVTKGLERDFFAGLPWYLKHVYNSMDKMFSKFTGLSSDIFIVAKKT